MFEREIGVRAACAMAVGLVSWLPSVDASACGGGVTGPDAVVEIDSQRVLMSVRADGKTDVVVELVVPAAAEPWGVLIPLPVEPTIDPMPVSTDWIARLAEVTRVTIADPDPGGSEGSDDTCGCGSDAAAGKRAKGVAGGGDRGVDIGSSADIGPVTATALMADTGDALTEWLGDNGFVVPAEHQSLVDSYAGPGKWFLAFRRNEGAPAGEASGVVVHFSMSGDHRGYPLRISRMGSGEEIAITLFFAAPEGVAPAKPFEAMVVSDLDQQQAHYDYRGAVRAANDARADRAFLVEGMFGPDDLGGWRSYLERDAQGLTDPDQTLTRIVTVMPSAALTEDVMFTEPPPAGAELASVGAAGSRRARSWWLACALPILVARRRLRPASRGGGSARGGTRAG